MKKDCLTNDIASTVSVEILDWYNLKISELGLFESIEKPPTFTIVAGDVMYKKELIEPFFTTVKLLFNEYTQYYNSFDISIQPRLILCHIPRAGEFLGHISAISISFIITLWDDYPLYPLYR